MGTQLHVRVSQDEYERWSAVATQVGTSLSEWVRKALNAEVEDRNVARMTDRFAERVLHYLLPEVERLLTERLPAVGASPQPYAPQGFPQSYSAPIQTGPRPWDPSCYSADLHRNGSVCNECGGSFQPKR